MREGTGIARARVICDTAGMDGTRYSTIAHHHHLFCSPLSPATVDTMIRRMELPRHARILDVGCGKAEMLIRAIEQCAGTGVGVDMNAAFLEAARERADRRIPDGALALYVSRIEDLTLDLGKFDAVMCVGSTHALGGYAEALGRLAAFVRPGGVVVAGEGYWRQKPAPGYLAVLSGTEDEFTTHEGNVALGVARGLTRRFDLESSETEWDAYEDLYAETLERFAAEHPDDPDRDAMIARIRPWRAAYLEWGRATLGFGVYGFEKR